MAPTLSQSSIMKCLPSELIHIICELLPDCDLGNFRLASKDCAEMGVRHIVRDIHVMFTAKSFHNMLQISKHPVLRRHVAEIFYEARFLENLNQATYSDLVEEYDEGIREWDTTNDWSEEDYEIAMEERILKGWALYKPMLDSQEYLKGINYDYTVFAQALAQFPSLKKITMISDSRAPSDQLRQAYEGTLATSHEMVEGEEEEVRAGVRALGSLFSALYSLPTKLEVLEAHRVHWSLFAPAPPGLSFYGSIFTHLRHIHLTLEADYDDLDEQDSIVKRHEGLGNALRSAIGLETLKLTFGEINSVPQLVLMERQMNVPVDLATLFKDVTWRTLKSLELSVVTISAPDFTLFLLRHAKTLRHIKLSSMWLTEDHAEWDRVFRTIKHRMSLETLAFKGIWGADSEGERQKMMKMESEHGNRLCEEILNGNNSAKEAPEIDSLDAVETNLLTPFTDTLLLFL